MSLGFALIGLSFFSFLSQPLMYACVTYNFLWYGLASVLILVRASMIRRLAYQTMVPL
jgi:hypothetical protein